MIRLLLLHCIHMQLPYIYLTLQQNSECPTVCEFSYIIMKAVLLEDL